MPPPCGPPSTGANAASSAFGPGADPYQLLFPAGVAFAIWGAALWAIALWPGVPYPGNLHASVMIEGFELAFISGFLLTILPRITRTDATDRREVPIVIALLAAFAVAALVGRLGWAHACALGCLLVLATALVRRFVARKNDPPEEAIFVPLGLALGIAGAAIQLAASVGGFVEPSYRIGIRLMSIGMVLSLVLGFGSLLVPVFLEIKDPLVIPRIARPHERAGRRALYATIGLALALTFVADARDAHALGSFGRALVATVMLVLGWKVWRLPGRRTVPAWVMWSAGWFVGIGLWAAALLPRYEIAALHLTLLGGYGALTMGIAARVVVTHGGHGPAAEARVVTPVLAALLAFALGARLGAEFDPVRAAWWLAASAVCWVAAWVGWIVSAYAHLQVPRPEAQATS